jgi:glycosyltransferase involved in cell wall biosynthesis
MRTRIAIVLGRLVIGGTTIDTLQVARYLQEQYEVMLITGGGGKDEFEAAYLTEHLASIRHERIPGFEGDIRPWRDYQAYRRLKQIFERFRPQIVHTHTAKAGLLGRLAARAAGVPVIVHTYHGLLFHGYYHPWRNRLVIAAERWLARLTTAVVALSQAQAQALVQQYHICQQSQVHIVPLGIELASFADRQAQKREAFRQRYKLADHEVAVGIVGRIVAIKNHPFFLEVVRRLKARGASARFFIIGDGVQRKRLQQACHDMGIDACYYPEDPRVATLTFTSWVTEVDKAMAGLDIIVLTSINEGTPVSLMEAQASARPVVTTRAGGIHDILQPGVTGWVVEQGDVDGFAAAVAQLVENNELRQKAGQQGQAWARLHFQKEREVANLVKLYKSLVEKN